MIGLWIGRGTVTAGKRVRMGAETNIFNANDDSPKAHGQPAPGHVMKTVRVISPGWQERCGNLAKGREAFEVKGFLESNVPFLQGLCAAYRYEMEETDTSMIMLPLALAD